MQRHPPVMQRLSYRQFFALTAALALPVQLPAQAQELSEPLLKLSTAVSPAVVTGLVEFEQSDPFDRDQPVPVVVPAPPRVAIQQGPAVVSVSQGEASWYGPGFYGNRTANGEIYRQGTLTAAHRSLPFDTRVRVTNLWNGRTTVVRINDRGPYVGNRVLDLGHGAAHELGLVTSGIAQVKLEVLQ